MLRRFLIGLPALALALTACGAAEEPADANADSPDPDVLVVATTSILGDVVTDLVGDTARVEVLMPVGADPHDFQPSAQQAGMLREADLVIANGLGLEEGLLDTIESAEDEGVNVLEIAPLVDPIPFAANRGHGDDHAEEGHDEHEDDHPEDSQSEDHAEDHEGEDDHGHGEEDPHFWQDPLRMATAVELIASELAELDTGLSAAEWQERADTHVAELEALHTEITEILDPIPPERRKLVTNHEAFGYFADRYGFEILGVVIPGGSTLAEPSAQELGELVEVLEHTQVSAIFAENVNPSALAEAVAAELGGEVTVVGLYSDSLGEPGSAAATYPGMLRENARLIAEALS